MTGHGITWHRDARTGTVPTDMTDDKAVEIWQQILDKFPAWISGVIGDAGNRGVRMSPATTSGRPWHPAPAGHHPLRGLTVDSEEAAPSG
jgi:hypothetical protein